MRLATIAALTILTAAAHAQTIQAQPIEAQPVQFQTNPPRGVPEAVPPMLQHQATPPEPTTPPAHPFHDPRFGITFTVPAAWSLTRKDAEVSTFRLDAPTATRATQMRAVANISFNPHPNSTFSGALFYFSVTPQTTASQCASQASAKAPRTVATTQIAGLPFTHGYTEQGTICTESRDEIYTTQRKNICYRFDAVINTFCGGDVSGVQDISPQELDAVRKRMQAILDSVHLDAR
jgi:hypothetical protein